MIDLRGKRILCVSAHLDDVEFGCGGIISRFKAEAEFHILALTLNRRSYHGVLQEERDLSEQHAAMELLGIPRANLNTSDEIAGQMFPEYRQLILEELYRADKEIRPQLVLVPSYNDVHQDHQTVARSALKAFKRVSLWGYEIINSTYGFNPNLYVRIEAAHLKNKIAAVNCYQSQQNEAVTTADYFSDDVLHALAKVRGTRAGCQFAEAFETYFTCT